MTPEYVEAEAQLKLLKMPLRRLFGFSEIWRDNSTGTRQFFLFFVPIWRRDFVHSTAWFEDPPIFTPDRSAIAARQRRLARPEGREPDRVQKGGGND